MKNRVRPIEKQLQFKMKRPSMYRNLTLQQRTNLVKLVDEFGYDFNRISKFWKLNYSSVRHIYRTYKERGNKFVSYKYKCGRKRSASRVRAMEIVTKPYYLQRWYSLTLTERCEQLHRIAGVRISRFMLKDIYTENGIKLRRAG